MRIISEGKARCIEETRARHKLEGYNLNDEYNFTRCKDKKGEYIRVYPSFDEEIANNYYETCTTGVFSKYFKITEEQSIIK